MSWCDWCSVLALSNMLAVWCYYRNVTHPELRHVSEVVAVDTPTAVHIHVHTHASMIGVISTHFPHSRHGGGEKECGFTLSSSSLKSNLSLSRSSWTRRPFKGGRQSATPPHSAGTAVLPGCMCHGGPPVLGCYSHHQGGFCDFRVTEAGAPPSGHCPPSLT